MLTYNNKIKIIITVIQMQNMHVIRLAYRPIDRVMLMYRYGKIYAFFMFKAVVYCTIEPEQDKYGCVDKLEIIIL